MATQQQIKALSDARISSMKAAFDSGDVDGIMSWFSKDIQFEDTRNDRTYRMKHLSKC